MRQYRPFVRCDAQSAFAKSLRDTNNFLQQREAPGHRRMGNGTQVAFGWFGQINAALHQALGAEGVYAMRARGVDEFRPVNSGEECGLDRRPRGTCVYESGEQGW